ncbi:MAG TPA: hypothetical protein VG389_23480 [Myxococcota bacterium]|nr:hypothetical protein [Myxococcota bacterium]
MSGEAAKSRSACPYGAAALALPVAMLGAGLGPGYEQVGRSL